MSRNITRYHIVGEFDGAHFNGEYTVDEVVDRINSDSHGTNATLTDGKIVVQERPRDNESTVAIGVSHGKRR
jgi:hypothetical protein